MDGVCAEGAVRDGTPVECAARDDARGNESKPAATTSQLVKVGLGRQASKHEVYGTFLLDGDEFAIEMAELREVVDAPAKLQRMPLAPDYLAGLFHLRGRVMPVVELGKLLRMQRSEASVPGPRRLAIIRRGAACVGLMFDAVGEVLRVGPEELSPVSYSNEEEGEGRGIPVKAILCRDQGARIVQILDLAALFAIQNLPAIERMGAQDEAEARLTHRISDLYREKLIGFAAGGCTMALEMQCVAAILESSAKKPSPRRSELCNSIVTFRGRAVPVVSVARLLQLEGGAEGRRILICRIGESTVGFEVDDVTSIIPYSKERVMPVPVLRDYKAAVFRGCFTDREGRDFIVLDEEGLLSRPEIKEIAMGHERLGLEKGPAEEEAKASTRTPVLVFRIGKLYGLKLCDVVEVLEWREDVARTPDTPAAVLGVLNLRGTPIPVLDPRELFRIQAAVAGASPKILVFQHEASKIAMRVDSVETILALNTGTEHDLPELFFRADKEQFEEGFAKGVDVRNESGTGVAVVILQARQIVERLAGALAA